MFKQFSDKPYVYVHQPEYHAAFWGLTSRVDIWKADNKGNRAAWLGSLFITKDGFHKVGEVPIIMRDFCEGILRGGN